MSSVWRRCDVCKSDIKYGQKIQKCGVSSCRKFVFCSVDCWSEHDSVFGHKSAYAEEAQAPKSESEVGRRRIVQTSSNANSIRAGKDIPQDILIVASKLKSYIKAKHDLNTSANVMEKLSQLVRNLCDDAVDNARAEGRKTLMDRDF